MLHPAVTLDATLTARDALRRLAQHGYWTDPVQPAALEYAEAYVSRIKQLLAQRAARVPAGEGLGLPAADLQSTMNREALDVPTALLVLARPTALAWAAIRRQEGATIYWYARRVDELIGALVNVPAETPLRSALDLHEWGSDQTGQAGDLNVETTENFTGVVLHGQDFLAVARAEPSRRPPPPPGSGGGDGAGTRSITRPGLAPPEGTPPEPAASEGIRAYPLLETQKRSLVVGERLELVVGLAKQPTASATSPDPMRLPHEAEAATLDVELQIIAEGFEAPTGWRHVLTVRVDDPTKARVNVALVPLPQTEPMRLTLLIVHYLVGGVTCGSGALPVIVTQTAVSEPRPDPRGQPWLTAPSLAGMTLPAAPARPDIQIDIAKPDGNPAKGDYLCTLRNAHGITEPPVPLPIRLGDDAKTFAKVIIDDMARWSGDDLVDNLIESHGALVAGKLPAEFWTLLRAVAVRVTDRPITLQLNSAEPYVPWELALVDPPIYTDRPKLLAAQVAMGRWLLGDSAVASPPREAVSVKNMAAMAGRYNRSTGLSPLPEAEDEVKELERTLKAVRLNCDSAALKALLGAVISGGVQAVHFAGHGRVDPTRPGDAAFYLDNGAALSPAFFRRSVLGRKHAPFIFLNACMVGTAGEMLGDLGGFPGNCLAGGFTALVAPLWAVDDSVAKSIALEFYQAALAQPGRSVAEVLRDLRANYRSDAPVASYLAYVYYGNPHLKLSLSDASVQVPAAEHAVAGRQ